MTSKYVNILAVVPYFVPRIGGGETHLYQLAELLSVKGHSISILTQFLPQTIEYEEKGNIKIQRFGNALTRTGRRAGYSQILSYIKQHEFRNTVLYEYLSVGTEYRTAVMCEILAVARKKGIPRVVRIPSSKRVTELSTLYLDGIRELQQADCVISLNPGIYEELISFGLSHHQIQSIPNGVDVNRFKPSLNGRKDMRQSVGCTQDSIVFLCPSRLAPKKRIPSLLQLWKEIVETYTTDSSCELWVVGDDRLEAKQGEVSRQVKALSEELKLRNLRLFPGEPHSNMPKYFQASDVYISLSTQEGMSNAMLEAMATSLLVIAPATDAVTPLINDGCNGFLFIPGDLASAKHAISRFMNTSKKEREKMCHRNREIICENYKIEHIAEKFSRLFSQLVFGQNEVHL